MTSKFINIIRKAAGYCGGRNRFWVPLLCGLAYSLALPPFNSMLHPALAPMPLLSFIALIPFFFFATLQPRRRGLAYSYIYCAAMILGQHYWIGFTTADGLWIYILIGVALISLVWGALYFAAALAFRFCAARLPRFYIIVYPAVWVLVEYFRTLTDLAFPWAYIGYSMTGILPLAQFSSFTGVWGLSYLIVLGNIVIWELLRAYKSGGEVRQKLLVFGAWAALVMGIFVWGIVRMNVAPPAETGTSKVALMQSCMDQFNWGPNSLDTAITVSDSMVRVAAAEKPDFIIFSESALLCYLDRRPDIRWKVLTWAKYAGAPIMVGSLHWDRRPDNPPDKNEYDVYNTAFLTQGDRLVPYHKIMLVPFSEIMPFQAQFPILSRINLAGAGFKRGTSETVFSVNDNLNVAPYICYEIIFPSFVSRRLHESTNMLVNITNDGWFGRSSGPYQHAAMAQMRSIENGITLARAANSGISMFVDPVGRVIARTGLYTREMVVMDVPTYRIMTYYGRFGDWFVMVCFIIAAAGIFSIFVKKKRPGEITNPLLVEEQNLQPANACQSERL
ncbi:MAG: apolipoprotein N-acyltransferase [Chitinispirillia bacterium]|nr:apolipoprotein N-acyltransferase [Chitinispirillia bacterium]MCL2269256.1 apolipoprotein N-acyltransferase [Chitinispirillia bacterium]